MASVKKEIECLTRLQSLTASFSEILFFLVEEKLLTQEQAKSIELSSDRAKAMQLCLSDLNKKDKFQLLEYEWTILPVERIKLHIITDRNSKEFTYNF